MANMELARRGFLLGLGASIMTAPSIVRACNIMPIKVTDTVHWVSIEGLGLDGKDLTHSFKVTETLRDGFDFTAYRDLSKVFEPYYKQVNAIVTPWTGRFETNPGVDRHIARCRPLVREYVEVEEFRDHVRWDTNDAGLVNFKPRSLDDLKNMS